MNFNWKQSGLSWGKDSKRVDNIEEALNFSEIQELYNDGFYLLRSNEKILISDIEHIIDESFGELMSEIYA